MSVTNDGLQVKQGYYVGKGNKNGAWAKMLTNLGVTVKYGDWVSAKVDQRPQTGATELTVSVKRGEKNTTYKGLIIPAAGGGTTVVPAP